MIYPKLHECFLTIKKYVDRYKKNCKIILSDETFDKAKTLLTNATDVF